MADKVLLRRVALGLVVFAVAVSPGVLMAQDGDPVRIGVDGGAPPGVRPRDPGVRRSPDGVRGAAAPMSPAALSSRISPRS